MKISLFAAVLASTLLISACGDDTSSNPPLSGDKKDPQSTEKDSTKTPGTDSSQSGTQSSSHIGKGQNIKNQTSAEANSAYGTYTIDEANSLLTMDMTRTANDCVAKDGNLVWENVSIENTGTSRYEFRGDTLILYTIVGGQEIYGDIYVDGPAGKIEGTWHYTGCTINVYTYKTECDYVHFPIEGTSTFANGNVTNIGYPSERFLADNFDFMNSVFMYEIYKFLFKSQDGLYPMFLYDVDSSAIEDLIHARVNILEQTRTHEVFEYQEKRYEVSVKNANPAMTMGGILGGSRLTDFQFEISNGTTSCHLDHHTKQVDQSLCKNEYAENIEVITISNDSQTQEIPLATTYKETNIDEFEDCLGSL